MVPINEIVGAHVPGPGEPHLPGDVCTLCGKESSPFRFADVVLFAPERNRRIIEKNWGLLAPNNPRGG